MTIRIVFILVFLVSQAVVAATSVQSLSLSPTQQVKHLSQDEIGLAYQKAYVKMITNNPASVSEFKFLPSIAENTIGDTVQFNMLDYSSNEFYHLRAVLKAKGAHTQVWVDIKSIDSSFVTDGVISQILTTLEENTDASSIDPDKGIYQIDTETFGQPPNYDGDGLVDFLITDIRDGLENTNTYVAGFFSSWDQTNQGGSNKRDILYIDSKQGIYQNGNYNTYTVMGTVAHEFQHLIHYEQDPDEATFINEAMSELAGTLCGYGLSHPGQFLDDPNQDLTLFNNEIKDYASVNLWALYIYEQFGIDFVRNFVQNGQNGKEGFNATLSAMNYSTNFNEVFQNWSICNYVNDTDVDGKWGYQNPLAQNLRVAVNTPLNYPMIVTTNIKNYGSIYYKFSIGEDLNLTLISNYAYAKYIRKSAVGIEVIDLPIGSLYEDNDFGDSVTESVVIVGSILGGSSFTLTAEASSSVELVELGHDDGTPDPFSGTASFLYTQGTGKGWAVKYTQFEESENTLVQLKINASTVTTEEGKLKSTVLMHVWSDAGNSPGSDLITPVSYELSDGWNTVDCQQVFGQTITLPAVYYIGFTNPDDETGVAVGMDNSEATNFTWVLSPDQGARQMSDLELSDGTSLAGFNMMIRALISIPYVDTRAIFSIGLTQNPVFSENLDIYIIGDKRLDGASLTAQSKIGSHTQDLVLATSGTSGKFFVEHAYVLQSEGNLEISIHGKNSGSNLAAADTVITVGNVVLTKTGEQTYLGSTDGIMHLYIPEEAIKPSQYLLLTKGMHEITEVTGGANLKPQESLYTVFTTQKKITQPARIEFSIPKGKTGKVSIKDSDGWQNLPVEINPQGDRIIVQTSKLGVFKFERIDSGEPAMIVEEYRLEQNFPNPFNPETSITFSIKHAGVASLTIYNIIGQKIKTLITQHLEPATYAYKWDGTNEFGITVPTGVYLYQLRINGIIFTKKMVLIR
jgi:hypothetical protein